MFQTFAGIIGLFFCFSTATLISSKAFSEGNMTPEVSIKSSRFNRSDLIVRLAFTNNGGEPFYLYEYNLCDEGVLFDDIFSVERLIDNKKYDVSYGGMVDFFDVGKATEKNFIKIDPGKEVSCEVVLGNYYDLRRDGSYEVTYRVENPSYSNFQSAQILKSNTIRFILEN
ncbi:hypothetical protein [Microbulbifer sp. SAOS-129_SWC]|uniref:hypothetical protein n=1 Tax=Microbulbifer sp. SAOS-129_SWC TaxID=3145235 RepID=UPI003216633A